MPPTGRHRDLRHAAARRARDFAPLFVCALLGAQRPAQAPSAVEPVDRLLYADAERHLDAEDPVVRGEAALVLAAGGDPRHYDAVLRVAKDEAPEARLRGILALGYLGVSGCETLLEAEIEAEARTTPVTVVSAYALGLLPAEHAASAVTRQLLRFQEGSFKRQGDSLLAMLAALSGSPRVGEQLEPHRLALQQLTDDAAIRDEALRAALLATLGRVESGLGDRREDVLARGTPAERRAVLAALATTDVELDPDQMRQLTRLCRRDRDPGVRAAALAALTAQRHLPALDLAARAIKSGEPLCVRQGTRTALQLGGAPMRRAIERQLEFLDRDAQQALLAEFHGPLSPDFRVACHRLCDEPRNPVGLRTAAALALAQDGSDDLLPLLRRLFLEQRDPAALADLARALQRLEPAPAPLSDYGLVPAAGDEGADAGAPLPDDEVTGLRLRALLVAGHPQASRHCVAVLQRGGPAPQVAAVLRAVRQSRLPQVDDQPTRQLPAPLDRLLR